MSPTATLLIPCEYGVSHNEIENAVPAGVEAGTNVLLLAMPDKAGG
jgi:N-carbamoyl-L-amino-acid hydrolase